MDNLREPCHLFPLKADLLFLSQLLKFLHPLVVLLKEEKEGRIEEEKGERRGREEESWGSHTTMRNLLSLRNLQHFNISSTHLSLLP